MIVVRILVCIYLLAIFYNNVIREVRNSEIFKQYKYVKEFITALDIEIEK